MAPPGPTAAPVQAFEASLQADASARERSAMKLWTGLFASGMLYGLERRSVMPAVVNNAYLATMGLNLLFVGSVLLWLRRGHFRPWVPTALVLYEVTAPGMFLAMEMVVGTPFDGLISPIQFMWGSVIMISGLRMRPRLCLLGGAVASVTFLGLWALALPHLVQPVPRGLLPGAIVLRALFLLFSGIAASSIARHLLAKAEEALRETRARDLMSKYFLDESLGRGGMAEVFRATYCPEGGFEKTVAVKRVLPHLSENARFAEMFREEARLGALLNHPNLVQVLDCGLYQGSFVLAMEYVDGASLARVLKAPQPLSLHAVALLGAEVATALEYVHARVDRTGQPLRLVHRDVNPANLLLSRIGEVKLADFGVASAVNRAALVAEGVFYGKVVYGAPEQLRGLPVDGRTDLYALGLTLHEALTGRRVFEREDDARRAAGSSTVLPPSLLRPDVPTALEALVMRLLAPDPAHRPSSASEVRLELLRMVAGHEAAARAELGRRAAEAAELGALEPLTREKPRSIVTRLLTRAG